MKILVTGQNGFIGIELFRVLQNQGYQVRGAVRRADKIDPDIVVVGDVGEKTEWGQALEDIDVVVHLANRAHVLHDYSEDPLALFRAINVEGTIQLAKQAVEYGAKRFIFVSSIKVNGERTGEFPFTAADIPNPQDPYAISKMEAESELRKIGEEFSMEIVIVRPPLVYGPGVKGNFQRLTRLVEKGVPLPFAAINNKRSLVSLGNLVNLLALTVVHPAAANQTFLVSDGKDLSTPELI